MHLNHNLTTWLAALPTETASLWNALHTILDPLRRSGNQPDPAAVASLPSLQGRYEVFVCPRLADFKLVSRGRVCGQTVHSSHDAFQSLARVLYQELEKWPAERQTQEAKEWAG